MKPTPTLLINSNNQQWQKGCDTHAQLDYASHWFRLTECYCQIYLYSPSAILHFTSFISILLLKCTGFFKFQHIPCMLSLDKYVPNRPQYIPSLHSSF